MSKLKCVNHGRRSIVVVGSGGYPKTLHRADGSACPVGDVTINGRIGQPSVRTWRDEQGDVHERVSLNCA